MQKFCKTCDTEKSIDNFNICQRDGYQSRCKQCQSSWRRENRDKMNSYNAKYKNSNKDKIIKAQREYHKTHRVEEKEYRKKYLADPSKKGILKNNHIRRRIRKRKACLPWVNIKEVQEFYKNCPEGYEVDHIIPLKNDYVCGLHILCNLQYLSKEENRKKSNKFDGTLENESWKKDI